MNALYAVLSVAAILVVLFAIFFRMMAARFSASISPADWLVDFSVATYAPMERLLDESDFAFLASQPGYDARIARQLRAERKQVFKGYLRRLVRDFNQLLAIAKLMIVYGSEDRGDFAKSLWRVRITFYYSVCVLRCKLALYPAVNGSCDAAKLVGVLQGMRDALNHLAPRIQETAV